jgi:anti-sigma B factor antagonist
VLVMTDVASVEVTRKPLGDDEWLIVVAGQVDLFTAPQLKAVVSQAIDDGAQRLVVDLTATTFMDSTGLGVLVGARKRIGREEHSISVVLARNSEIRRVFEFAGLDRLFEFADPGDRPGS